MNQELVVKFAWRLQRFLVNIIYLIWRVTKYWIKFIWTVAVLFALTIASVLSALFWLGVACLGFYLFIPITMVILIIVAEVFSINPPGDKNILVFWAGVAYLFILIAIFKFKKVSWTRIFGIDWVGLKLISLTSIWDDNCYTKRFLIRLTDKIGYSQEINSNIKREDDDQDNENLIINKLWQALDSEIDDEKIKHIIEILEKYADKGNSDAQVKLSYLYLGKKARLGSLYLGKKNITENPDRAFYWASVAAKRNVSAGLFNLGLFYKEGIGTTIDYDLAYNSFILASKEYSSNEGKGKCFIELGDFSRYGLGRDINLDQALSYYNNAMKYGNKNARAKVYETQKLIDKKNNDPDFILEQAERLRRGLGTEKDVDSALPFYLKAANLGNVYSQTELAYFYLGNEGISADYPKAYYWATKASEKNPEAKYYLAVCYDFGLGVKENGPSALMCYLNFINANTSDSDYMSYIKAKSKYYVGCIYRDGKCGSIDMYKALEWFELARESGYEDAEQAANEVRESLERQNNKSSNELYKLIDCPSCRVNIRIPTPVPTAIIRCKACNVRLSIKQDNHGNIHVLLLNDTKQKGEQSSDMPMTLEDAARILGVSIHDDLSIIKNAWRTLRGQYHPDKLNQMGDKLKELAELESKKINKAYQILSNR